MKWTREEYDEGHCWKAAIPPLGDFCIDYADYIDAERPWLACWYVGDYETEIGRAATENGAKALVAAWLHDLEAKIGNARAQGFALPDDGE